MSNVVSNITECIKPARVIFDKGMPFSLDFNDIYGSSTSGLDESVHVFIAGNHLTERFSLLENNSDSKFIIAETGFGTGLNFLQTWKAFREYAPESSRLYFYSTDLHPLLKKDLKVSLDFWPELADLSSNLIEKYPELLPGMHYISFDDGRINLILMLGDATTMFRQLLIIDNATYEHSMNSLKVDAWFLDGFTPSKNPDLWQDNLFRVMALLSYPKTTLTTYSVARIVKDGLSRFGFLPEKRKGFGQKRDMLYAVFNGFSDASKKGSTPWHYIIQKKPSTKKALIVGSGISGIFLGFALARKGYEVNILDKNQLPCQGGSGNKHALLFPKLSHYQSLVTELMWLCYFFALRFYEEQDVGKEVPLFHIPHHIRDKELFEKMRPWLDAYPTLATSKLLFNKEGIIIPRSRIIDIPDMCLKKFEHPNLSFHSNIEVSKIYHDGTLWHVGDYSAPVLILANAENTSMFPETSFLPLKSTAGQMTFIKENPLSRDISIPICGNGHISPSMGGIHAMGATYHNFSKASLKINEADDNKVNLQKINDMLGLHFLETDIIGSWQGIRAATPDYLPIIGAIPDITEFNQRYKLLSLNSKTFIPFTPKPCDGLYVFTGLGSKGLTLAPLCAEWLASHINKDPDILPQHLIRAISPARFLYRSLIRS